MFSVVRQTCVPLDLGSMDMSGCVVQPGWRQSCQRMVLYWFADDTYGTQVTNPRVVHVFEAYHHPDGTIYIADVLIFHRQWLVRYCVSERVERIRKFLASHPDSQPDTTTPDLWFEYPSRYRRCCIHNGVVRVLPFYPACRAQQVWFYRDLFPSTVDTLCFSRLRCQYGTIMCWPALYGLQSVDGEWHTSRGVCIGRSSMPNGVYLCGKNCDTGQWCAFGPTTTIVSTPPPEDQCDDDTLLPRLHTMH
jgi:hypothetical protein